MAIHAAHYHVRFVVRIVAVPCLHSMLVGSHPHSCSLVSRERLHSHRHIETLLKGRRQSWAATTEMIIDVRHMSWLASNGEVRHSHTSPWLLQVCSSHTLELAPWSVLALEHAAQKQTQILSSLLHRSFATETRKPRRSLDVPCVCTRTRCQLC